MTMIVVSHDCSLILLLLFVVISLISCHASASPKSPSPSASSSWQSSSSSSSFFSLVPSLSPKVASFADNGARGRISLPSFARSRLPANKRFRSRVGGDRRSRVSRLQQRQTEGDKITQEINKLANDLKERKILLSTAREQHRQLSQKLKLMIKKTRKRRLYFFDSLLEKTLKYNRSLLKRIKEQMNRIDSSNELLSGPGKRNVNKSGGRKPVIRDFEANHIMREISRQNIVSDSDLIIADSSKRISLLNAVLDDMAREKNLI